MGGNFGWIDLFFREPVAISVGFVRLLGQCLNQHGLYFAEYDYSWEWSHLPELPQRRLITAEEAYAQEFLDDRQQSLRCIFATASPRAFPRYEVFFEFLDYRKLRQERLLVVPHFDLGQCAFDERRQDMILRLGLSLHALASQLPTRQLVIHEMYGGEPCFVVDEPFVSDQPRIFVGEWDWDEEEMTANWLATKPADFPIEFYDYTPSSALALWTGGRRGQGDLALLPYCPYRGCLLDVASEPFDWMASMDRIELLRRLWQCVDRESLLATLGPADFKLGGIFPTAEFCKRNEHVGINEQFVYVNLLPDAAVIVREWRDGIYTALGATRI